jgi:tetratricopeptide (TPR) repeat protein
MLGRLAEGGAVLRQERVVAEAYQQNLTVARIDLNLGWLQAALGQPAAALACFQSARERFQALGNHMDAGTTLLLEAALFERIGALREARRSYARARTLFADLGTQPLLGIALVRGAAACRRDGEHDQAAELLDSAERLWQTLDQPAWLAEVCFERVDLALDRSEGASAVALLAASLPLAGNAALEARRDLLLAEARAILGRESGAVEYWEQARHDYDRVLRYAEGSGDRWMQRRALAGLGRLALPDTVAAWNYLSAAVALDEQTRQELSVEELKAGFQKQASDLLPLLARIRRRASRRDRVGPAAAREPALAAGARVIRYAPRRHARATR